MSAMVSLGPAIHLSRVKNSSATATVSFTDCKASSVILAPKKVGLC